MSITAFPIIAQEDFEAFRSILGPNLPNTYDEWLYLADKSCADIEGGGGLVERVKINPNKFIIWLATHGNDRTIHGLRNFAFDQAGRS